MEGADPGDDVGEPRCLGVELGHLGVLLIRVEHVLLLGDDSILTEHGVRARGESTG